MSQLVYTVVRQRKVLSTPEPPVCVRNDLVDDLSVTLVKASSFYLHPPQRILLDTMVAGTPKVDSLKPHIFYSNVDKTHGANK